jgi:hypothetical protein
MYIPGHAGIQFNERADNLAGAAEAFGDLELTDGDIFRGDYRGKRTKRRVHSAELDYERKRSLAEKERM